MAQEKRLGSTIPRGVVDTKNGSVGVPNQASIEEEVRSLREQVNALSERLSELGISSGRAIANTGRRTGEMAREHPAWTALAVIGLLGLLAAGTSRPYWHSRSSSRIEDLIADIEDRLSDLKSRYWSNSWRPW
ncbi:hypothetical protein [Sinorhizobium medicae]|uniref:hypothetical protein n=1 Tax=Sinorhizobium medicae TaxID=110321 RepID=UPI0003714576|nr:hypothetical protein [Sinorhizobium medicae]